MALWELEIKTEYRSFLDDIVKNFYIPILSKSISYKRAVGFFSSSALSDVARGISAFVQNGGTMQLVVSPYLSETDIQAIKEGYSRRNEIVKNALLRYLKEPEGYFEWERLNILSHLIADSILDIKVAIAEDQDHIGMYHEKMGIFTDSEGNKVAFSGSMNETSTAFHSNYESLDAYCSWIDKDAERVQAKDTAFTRLWANDESKIEIIDFPELKQEIIDRYKKGNPNYKIDIEEEEETKRTDEISKRNNFPVQPENVELRDYQIAAINNWASVDYCGIFDMATGTGKTITGLGAITYLSKDLQNNLAVFIVCPYQHLVEQWIEDIENFNIRPIIGYSASSQPDWKRRLDNAIRDKKLGVRGKEFFCFISTNATFSSSFIQSQIQKIRGDILLVIDEAHNFGAPNLSRLLTDKFTYRLGLSATIERFRDDEGTKALFNFFGKKCIEYTLEQAIKDKKLTEYKYYPVLCTLTNAELERYLELSAEIKRCIVNDGKGHATLSEHGKRLALERARLIAGAIDKLDKLEDEIAPYISDKHILVYCGATKLFDYSDDFTSVDDFDIRQIDEVTKRLGNKLAMNVSQFTSRESIKERKRLKKEFSSGEHLQALIAIKCLDEGVNIPAIKTAFILASTSNPKEYIQRRGRVLRRFENKEYATIFDFITLPYSLSNISGLTQFQLDNVVGLVKNELQRCNEFSRMALNKYEAEEVLGNIKKAYQIDDYKINIEEDFFYAE
ncbi:MAG: DEAD/DEAH box helicase family protein [Bacteroidales bacterium]|jgi:superfamily II DNA or RNA helicase|nr:DEAD/DEAH box helicase family protein [Bacteroidales bacterium]